MRLGYTKLLLVQMNIWMENLVHLYLLDSEHTGLLSHCDYTAGACIHSSITLYRICRGKIKKIEVRESNEKWERHSMKVVHTMYILQPHEANPWCFFSWLLLHKKVHYYAWWRFLNIIKGENKNRKIYMDCYCINVVCYVFPGYFHFIVFFCFDNNCMKSYKCNSLFSTEI